MFYYGVFVRDIGNDLTCCFLGSWRKDISSLMDDDGSKGM